jgi:hypothetical protein
MEMKRTILLPHNRIAVKFIKTKKAFWFNRNAFQKDQIIFTGSV